MYAGTKVLQHTESIGNKRAFPKSPDGGCPGFVLRTGFRTTQGNLMRTILYASQRVTANNLEALMFISILLVFAVAASGYVLYDGIQDATRSRFKLLLHCIMIVTVRSSVKLPVAILYPLS